MTTVCVRYTGQMDKQTDRQTDEQHTLTIPAHRAIACTARVKTIQLATLSNKVSHRHEEVHCSLQFPLCEGLMNRHWNKLQQQICVWH